MIDQLLFAALSCFTPHSAPSWVSREITAYNVGVTAQTDDEPCIGAAGVDICKLVEQGELVCAANFVPLWSQITIDPIGTCTVLDRMNKRYPDKVDIAFPKDARKEAKIFGRRTLKTDK